MENYSLFFTFIYKTAFSIVFMERNLYFCILGYRHAYQGENKIGLDIPPSYSACVVHFSGKPSSLGQEVRDPWVKFAALEWRIQSRRSLSLVGGSCLASGGWVEISVEVIDQNPWLGVPDDGLDLLFAQANTQTEGFAVRKS